MKNLINKKIIFLPLMSILVVNLCFSQFNFIPNPGFEYEKPTKVPLCDYSARGGGRD